MSLKVAANPEKGVESQVEDVALYDVLEGNPEKGVESQAARCPPPLR